MLSGQMSAEVVAGAQAKGTLVFIKHFALNDQEANRVGGAVFADEQSTRELGARWSGGHAGLMTDTLRDEWGFNGVVVTDQASFSVFAYEDLREGLEAGTDLWLNTDAELWALSADELTPTVQQNIVRAAHNVAYAVAHSNAMNGLSAGAEIQSVVPLWQWGLIAVDVVLGLLVAGTLFLVTRRLIVLRRSVVTVSS